MSKHRPRCHSAGGRGDIGMKIGLFNTGSNPIPPKNYGGSQAVTYITAEKLVELGHTIYLFAPEGSCTSGKLIKIDSGWGEATEHNNTIKYLGKYVDGLDIIIDTTAFALPGRVWKDLNYINRCGGDTNLRYCQYVDRNLVFPSRSHLDHHNKGNCSCSKRRSGLKCEAKFIHKPVCFPGELKDLSFGSDNSSYYLCLGLIQEHKGTHFAVEFARKLGVKLRIIGPIGNQYYFNKHIKPYLNNKITYETAISFNDKWKVLDKAIATLFTTNCEEGGPNVPMESLLMGTPVIAFNKSTVMEMVVDKVTGLLCKNVDEMCDRVKELGSIDAHECRKDVLDKFSVDKYINKYIELIKKVINGERWL